MKIVRYRIVRDNYKGYECQKWRMWFPFWTQMNITNTHSSIENAKKYIQNSKKHSVWID